MSFVLLHMATTFLLYPGRLANGSVERFMVFLTRYDGSTHGWFGLEIKGSQLGLSVQGGTEGLRLPIDS